MKKIIFSILMIATLTSCEKFLDVKPAGKLIPEEGDIASFDRLLNNFKTVNNVYRNNNSGSLLFYLTDDVEISDIQANYAWTLSSANVDCYFAHVFKTPYSNPNVQDIYWNEGFYRAAQYFNACIDGINGVRTSSVEREANETIAQATIARAWGYFYAALGYGPVYKPGGDNSRKVIPFRTSSDVMSPMEDLSTMQQIFDRVLLDIHQHLKNIPDNVPSNTRFGKVQTYAFLAHYHLFTQKYDSVAYYANKALTLAAQQKGNMADLFYDMNLFSWADPLVVGDPDRRNASAIKTSQGSEPLSSSYNREICLFRVAANTGNPGTSVMSYPSADFLSLFDDTTDLRREYFFFEYNGYSRKVNGITYDDGRKILNYQTGATTDNYNNGNKMTRTSGYTYPEILLMRAEGRARTNDLTGALEDLNYLRKFRHKTGTPNLNISGQDDIIQEVINERRRELPVASPKRFFDLKRFCLESGKPWCKSTVSHIVKGVTYTQSVDSDYFVLPISNDILKWNPQWGIPLNTASWSSSVL